MYRTARWHWDPSKNQKRNGFRAKRAIDYAILHLGTRMTQKRVHQK